MSRQSPPFSTFASLLDKINAATPADGVHTDAGTTAPLTGGQMVREAGICVREHIRRQPHIQRLFSFMPTLMTRLSPFHLHRPPRRSDWPLVRLDTGATIGWGRMAVVGELLVIFDETVLFGLLALMKALRREAFETSLAQLCHLAGTAPGPRSAAAVWQSVQRLAGTRIDLELISGKGQRRRALQAMTGSILSYADRNADRLRLAVNPYFLEMYGDSFVTNIDLKFRATLRHDISKAFYRYFQGQLEAEHRVDLAALGRAVNLDPALATAQLATKVRSGLRELEARGYLAAQMIDDQGQVRVVRQKNVLLRGPENPLLL